MPLNCTLMTSPREIIKFEKYTTTTRGLISSFGDNKRPKNTWVGDSTLDYIYLVTQSSPLVKTG